MDRFGCLYPTMAALATMAASAQPHEEDFARLDLKTLMQMEVDVTTATKNPQSIFDVAAPIHVIAASDIRRSGATTLPEALRLAPGVVVGRIDASRWIVSLRGFAWQYANKALVLVDGRAVHTPLNSSVYWNALDIPMEDIERIEVIRGPADARWGSHAVNGIINVITQSATQVRGTSMSAAVDSRGDEIFTVRHGGALGPHANYRVYAKHLAQSEFPVTAGMERIGNRSAWRTGIRMDGARDLDRFMFTADVQEGRDASILAGQNFVLERYDINEWSALGRWERDGRGGLQQQAQLSLDRLEPRIYEDRKTVDFAYQARLPAIGSHTWTLGVVYKNSSDTLPENIAIEPTRMRQQTYGAFVHDSIRLSNNSKLLLGSQFEHNRFTGWEIQPTAQLIITPHERRSYWASVSHAVRTPMRTEEGFNLQFPIGPNAYSRIVGNPALDDENVLAWQAGARLTLSDELFVDLVMFYNDYEDLIIQQAGTPIFEPLPAPGRTIFPAVYANSLSGHTTGAEVAVKAHPLRRWNIAGSYSLFSQSEWSDPLGFGSVTAMRHQGQFHSNLTLAPNLEWNADFYYVGPLSTGIVRRYYKLDTQLAWTPTSKLRVAAGIKDALDTLHREAGVNAIDRPADVPRRSYLQVMWQF